ncbi:DNA-processing protein DprA [Chitinophaga qingshengii]|uniref:DNA-protecting protein DprA n=1 Tax=Chitinophaga qingshengii TaxID=1569794 RepID=A0ABR7TJR4_9BACT|nr:DNA-processing protein DprA [Chitinophaga qingshengii]MBC9930736.1 DNA-protecting protein DprA [Chitinophaga qingshengii]
MSQELLYQIALTRIPLIGDVIIRKLLDTFGTASAIFRARQRELENIETVGSVRANAIRRFRDFAQAEKEISFIEKYHIRPLFCTDTDYPQRLHHCYDGPSLLYYKGSASLNAARMVSIVGTRRPSAYGRRMCRQLTRELAAAQVTVVSGLAYGIDILAHETALEAGTPTIGVLAHGLDRIYPAAHKTTAVAMMAQGGLLTDFMSGHLPDRQNFPKRNRIVAGICDATVVIESGIQGGSLITADLAGGYNRDVFCIPGRADDPQAAGCNHLIKNNKAMLISGAADIIQMMGWETQAKPAVIQQELFLQLSDNEQKLMPLFREKSPRHLEELYLLTGLTGSQVAEAVFNLEMRSVLKSLPGQRYELIR